jgi:hypothetical protein
LQQALEPDETEDVIAAIQAIIKVFFFLQTCDRFPVSSHLQQAAMVNAPSVSAAVFEKDDDSNHHIDFISASAVVPPPLLL